MNLTISGFFCWTAMKPARSVGWGSLGSSGLGILNFRSFASLPWQVWQFIAEYFFLSKATNSFFIWGTTVDFMYFFLALTSILSHSIFFPAATAAADGALGASAAL